MCASPDSVKAHVIEISLKEQAVKEAEWKSTVSALKVNVTKDGLSLDPVGNCFYTAVARQLERQGWNGPLKLMKNVVDYPSCNYTTVTPHLQYSLQVFWVNIIVP